MKLIIVESPKKCDTIGRYLGADYKVMASQGHIRDLALSGKGGLGIDIEHDFKPRYIVSKGKNHIVKNLKNAVSKADEVLLATDPDREGEAISWHLAEVLGLDISSTKRLEFHEITKPALLNAIEHPSHINMNRVNSQETRRMYDRIIGFKLSSLLQRKIGSQSAGRVQSVTLRLIVDNDREIADFKPEEYWTMELEFDVNGISIKATLDKVDGKSIEIHSKKEADALLARVANSYPLTSLLTSKKRVPSKLPFITSTMQQEAYNRFHFSTSRTQALAQRLYEGMDINGEHVGLITYMRTDSVRISEEFYQRHAKPYILENFGPEYLGYVKASKSKERIQDAHEAIRPTGTHRTPDYVSQFLSQDEAKLYRLIYDRAMASMMSDEIREETTAIFAKDGLSFRSTGSRSLFKGFKAIYGQYEDEKFELLPPLIEGFVYPVHSINSEQKFTKAPARFTEAKVVKTMEEKGIGRPSTYASTIKTLITRKYVTSKGGVLTPTEEGKKTTFVLEKYFPEIVSDGYTANMEKELDQIESGTKTKLVAMKDFYYPFIEKFEDVSKAMYKDPQEETGELCPICGAPIVKKKSRYGTFEACSNYPKCKYIKRPEKVEPEETGELCPECGKPLVKRKDKKGKEFIGCSGYPSCHYSHSNEEPTKGKRAKKAAVSKGSKEDYVKPCPECKTGHLIIKHGKKVDFLGCTNYPRCKYHEWLENKKKSS